MKYHSLGRSGLNVSVIGFGCMSLGKDKASAISLLHSAIERGINFLDTADLYDKGWNEETVGMAIKEKRKDIILATKVGNQWRADGTGWDWNPRKEYILDSVEKSLSRLGTDYIDLYQLHGGTIEDPIDETIEAFELLQKQGKIRFYGISSIRPNVIREYIRRSSITSVMMQYSLLDRRPEEECLELLKQHGIGVLSRGALAQGLLINKPAKDYLTLNADSVTAIARLLNELSGLKRTATQAALRFVLQNPAISSAVVGIRTREQLEEVLGVIDSPLFSDDEIDLLRKRATPAHYQDHR